MSRNPHFVQIGLDFGTAYSKCICRDVMIDKAWVHIPSSPKDKELPFLIPSIVFSKMVAFQLISNLLAITLSMAFIT